MSGFGLGPLPRSYDAAVRDARDKKASVRLSAMRDLARHAEGVTGSRAVGALLDALANDSSAEVRAAAAVALADAGSRDAVAGLVEAADDLNEHVRQMALLALGEVSAPGDARALRAAESALASDRAPLRFQGLIAVNRLDRSAAGDRVLAATADADPEVRHVAFRILEERSTNEAGVVRIDPDVAKAARAALEDDVLSVRLGAAILLARSGDSSVGNVIAEAVNRVRERVDLEDLGTAIELVSDLGLASATPGLMRRAWGGLLTRDPLAYEARIALARMGDERATKTIVRALSAWSRDTRTLAVVAAGRARLAGAREKISAMRGNPSLAEPDAVEEALAKIEAVVASRAEPPPKESRP